MGKTKKTPRRRAAARRAAAAGTSSAQPYVKPDSFESSPAKLALDSTGASTDSNPLLEQLGSADAASRHSACLAVSTLADNDKLYPRLVSFLKNPVSLRLVLQLLFDPDASVRLAAAGAVRNLSLSTPDVCVQLVHADALTGIVTLLANADSSTSPELLCHVVAVMGNLCESSDFALEAFLSGAAKSVPLLLAQLQAGAVPLKIEIAQLLNTVTDECPPAVALLHSIPDALSLFVSLATNTDLSPQVRMLCTSILCNIRTPELNVQILEGIVPIAAGALDMQPVEALGACLGDVQARTTEFEAAARHAEAEGNEEKILQFVNKAELWRDAVTVWKQRALGVQLALEVLTNVSAAVINEPQNEDDVPPEVALVAASGAMGKVFQHSFQRLADAHVQQAKALLPPAVAARLGAICATIRQRGMTCITNMVISFPTPALGDVAALWTQTTSYCEGLWPLFRDQHDPMATEELVHATGILWALLRRGFPVQASKAHVELAVNLMRGGHPRLRVHGAGIAGAVGQQKPLHGLNFVICSVLLETLEKSMQDSSVDAMELLVEALNAVIDLYSADDVHLDVVQQVKLYPRLAALHPQFAAGVQSLAQSGMSDEALLMQLMETADNLGAFLQYKKQQAQ